MITHSLAWNGVLVIWVVKWAGKACHVQDWPMLWRGRRKINSGPRLLGCSYRPVGRPTTGMFIRMEEDKPATDKERLGPPAIDKEGWDPQPQTENWNPQLQIEAGIPKIMYTFMGNRMIVQYIYKCIIIKLVNNMSTSLKICNFLMLRSFEL